MKKINKLIVAYIVAIFGIYQLSAQNTGIAKSLGLYIFPSNDQD